MLVGKARNQSLVNARQLSLRGTDAFQRNRDQDAELLFSQALSESPQDERAHWGYASVLWKSGDKRKALEHMNEAFRLSGRNPDYAIQLGQMHLDLGQFDSAKALAIDVLAVNRNHKIIEGDTRVKLTNEVLAGIRILRYMGWERAFEKKIDEVREHELVYLLNMNAMMPIFIFCIMLVPIVMPFQPLSFSKSKFTPKSSKPV
jgi:tetratricopeptide (TPR) repeat protein